MSGHRHTSPDPSGLRDGLSTPCSPTSDYRYQIILRGECGPLVAGLFGDTAIECSHGRTCIIAAVRDDSGLYGLLDRIQDLALHLVSLNELDGAEGADARR